MTDPLNNPMQNVGTLMWRLFVVALALILIFLNLRVLRHEPRPVGPEQGGVIAFQRDLSGLKDRLAQDEKANADLQGDLKVVTDKLQITQGQLKKARLQAEAAAEQNGETTRKLSALDTSVRKELATKAATDEVTNVDTKVSAVSADLNSTKEELKMAKSEMGTLIARNYDEITQLRRLGERDYVEFTIDSKNKPQKVANITIELKNINEKKHSFSVVMTVQDKRFVKKNRSMNEPIFFYAGGRYPEELVVNRVAVGSIRGYLSIPKNVDEAATVTASKGRSMQMAGSTPVVP